MTNDLEKVMDRMWEAEQEHRRRTEFQQNGIDKITYENGKVVFTRIPMRDFYK